MLLGKTVFALLLAPAAIATPVPGKEIGVRESSEELDRRAPLTSSFYKPDLDALCRAHKNKYAYAVKRSRHCEDHQKFAFECKKGSGTPEDPYTKATYTVRGRCRMDHFCVLIEFQTDPDAVVQVAEDDYLGKTDIACVKLTTELHVTVPRGKGQYKSPLSKRPAGPSGSMIGTFELNGDISGSRPILEWRYWSPEEPGENLLGQKTVKAEDSKKKTNLYSLKYNYNNDAQVFVDVDYLSPLHGDITLDAYIAFSPTPFKFGKGGGGRAADLEERDVLGPEQFEDKESQEA